MKKYSRILIIVNLILLLGYFNWSVFQKEQTLKDGQLVLLPLAPVDPRSLMQGDYMNLNYEVNSSSSALINEQTATHGYAILQTDSNQVGQLIRLQDALTPLNDNEIAIRYKIVNKRIFLDAESFFFEEGQDSLYQNARYGGLKIDDKGQSLLIGLYDENFQRIQPN